MHLKVFFNVITYRDQGEGYQTPKVTTVKKKPFVLYLIFLV